jgi:lipopolysaccharide cholinephosphotransferase
MNRQEFKEEVLQSKICPNNFEQIYEEFNVFQSDAIRTLNEFHNICERNGIHYQLAFGSLLGAIRDNGQIPWDYDIDVMIPFSEKERLISTLNEKLSPEFHFCCIENTKDWSSFIMRLAPKKYDINLLHVDVFYIVGAPESAPERDEFVEELHKYFHLIHYKRKTINSFKTVKEKVRCLRGKISRIFYTTEHIEKKMQELCVKYDFLETKTCASVTMNKRIFDAQKLWDTMIVENGEGAFRITRHYDYVLRSIYGNYYKIYPLENRLNEMMLNYQKISGKNVKWNSIGETGRYYDRK